MDELIENLQRKVRELSDNLENLSFSFWKKTGPSSNGITGSDLESTNFSTGVAGWRLDADGDLEANSGTFRGALVANSINIPDTTTANSFHVETDGDTFWGATTLGAAPASITKAGAITGSSVTITGGAITGTPIASIPNNSSTDISLLTSTHNLVFSVADLDTIAWTSGTINLSNGRTFSISAGNTGNMAALTYIYLDPAVSTTVLQTTTTYSTAVGANKKLIGTAQNHAVSASFIPFEGGQPLIDGENIGALSVVAGNIAASTITAGKLSVSQLSAITADMGAITAGTVTVNTTGHVKGGQTAYDTGTGFFLGYSGAAYKLSIGDTTAAGSVKWDGTTLSFPVKPPTVRTYTANDTWSKPTGLFYVVVEVIGGGGGGGAAQGTPAQGSGGGGGGYSTKTILAATLNATETVTIGAAGAAGTSAGNGGAGGTTSFGAHASSTGGSGGTGRTGAGPDVGGAAGAGSSGNLNIDGTAGGSSTNLTSGAGGGSFYGAGGGSVNGTTAGTAGTGYGGGGAGAASTGNNNNSGGAGTAGVVIVTEF